MRQTKSHYKEIEGYIVYPDGRVFSKKRGIFISPVMGKGKSKYYTVKVPHRIKLHRLVAIHFVPNTENKPEVNHKDGDKTNNNFWNLEWTTKLENMQHSHQSGLHNNKGENSGRSKLSNDDVQWIRAEIRLKKLTQKQIASHFNVDASTISDIKRGKSWASL